MAAANPGWCDSGGKVAYRECKCVLNARGATCAAVIATWACVRMHGEVLIVGSALCSHAACRFRTCSHLTESVGEAVGLLLGVLVMSTLENGVVMFIERFSLLLALAWGMCIFAIICTLGTCCTEDVSEGVAVCSNWLGCAFMCACVAPTICCRSWWPENFCLCLSCLGVWCMCGWLKNS